MAAADERLVVSRFEQRMIQVARALLGFGSTESLATWLVTKHEAPPCFSPASVKLLEETLAKGVVKRLAEAGWRDEPFHFEGNIVSGRLWQRVPLESRQLHFSRNLVEWLRWAVEHNVLDPPTTPAVDEPSLTVADRIFFALAAQPLARTSSGLFGAVARDPVFCRNAIVWLEHHHALSQARVLGRPDFHRWFAPECQWVLEAWQVPLTDAWFESAIACADATSIDDLRRAGETIDRIADEFDLAASQARRRDLGRFWLASAWQVLVRGGFDRERWLHRLSFAAFPMRERQRLYRVALAIPRNIAERLATWNRDARNVGYLDEGYAASQLFKRQWERYHGDRLIQAAMQLNQRFPMAALADDEQ